MQSDVVIRSSGIGSVKLHMSKRSAAASAAAHAASKKNSAVELTAGDEERARQALQVDLKRPDICFETQCRCDTFVTSSARLYCELISACHCLPVQQLDLLVGPKQPQVSSSWDKDELVSQLSDLCDTLLAESFRWQDVQQALQVATEQHAKQQQHTKQQTHAQQDT